jgi:hypothetical protein
MAGPLEFLLGVGSTILAWPINVAIWWWVNHRFFDAFDADWPGL